MKEVNEIAAYTQIRIFTREFNQQRIFRPLVCLVLDNLFSQLFQSLESHILFSRNSRIKIDKSK